MYPFPSAFQVLLLLLFWKQFPFCVIMETLGFTVHVNWSGKWTADIQHPHSVTTASNSFLILFVNLLSVTPCYSHKLLLWCCPVFIWYGSSWQLDTEILARTVLLAVLTYQCVGLPPRLSTCNHSYTHSWLSSIPLLTHLRCWSPHGGPLWMGFCVPSVLCLHQFMSWCASFDIIFSSMLPITFFKASYFSVSTPGGGGGGGGGMQRSGQYNFIVSV